MRQSHTAGSSTPVTESTRVGTVMPMMAPYMIHLCTRSPRAEGAFCSDMERSLSDVAAARVALGSDPKAVGRLELVLEVVDPNRPPAQWIRCSTGKSRTRMRHRQGRLHRDHLGRDHTARTYKDGYSPRPLFLSGLRRADGKDVMPVDPLPDPIPSGASTRRRICKNIIVCAAAEYRRRGDERDPIRLTVEDLADLGA